MDMVRAGITLYGMWPSEDVDKIGNQLKTCIIACRHMLHMYIKELPAGRAISYGGTLCHKRYRE